MTTVTAPAGRDSGAGPRPTELADGRSTQPAPDAAADRLPLIATAVVAVGAVLTTLPLRSIFTDWTWLLTSVGCALGYWLVVASLRSQGPARWWHSAIGLLSAAVVICWVFVPQHLFLGIIPTQSTVPDLSSLGGIARRALNSDRSPLASTAALRLLTTGLLVLLFAVTDLLAIVLRRPLLAAAPLLEILAVASTTSGHAAHPVWFVAAAAGFLLILLAGTRIQDQEWGPSVDGGAGRLAGGRQMAALGIVAALAVPMLLPVSSINRLARATHHSGTGGDGNSQGQTTLSNFASLRGKLQQGAPITLLKVQVAPGTKPFYVRQSVLDTFTNTGWVGTTGAFRPEFVNPLAQGPFEVLPQGSDQSASSLIEAQFTVVGLGGANLPLLANPESLTADAGTWNLATATADNQHLRPGQMYSETALQPNPSIAALRAAPGYQTGSDTALDVRYLSLPDQPASVTELAARLTADSTSAYDKAAAISSYFTNGKNGFVYSLDAPADDGRQALVTFLDKKMGFCQQYAAAAAVLMRSAGLASRVVLGYTHGAPDAAGNFTITTRDAHAWVESYFGGIGWVAFDPTPLAGADAGRAVPIPWAPHTSPSTAPGQRISSTPAVRPRPNPRLNPSAASTATVAPRTGTGLRISPSAVSAAGLLALLLALLAGPRVWRGRQRRHRLALARSTGTAEPLWLELAATAADRNALWPDTTTVAQVPEWLAGQGVDQTGATALVTVAQRVQADRFSARQPAAVTVADVEGFDQTLRSWSRRDVRQGIVARWIPRSLRSRSAQWRR